MTNKMLMLQQMKWGKFKYKEENVYHIAVTYDNLYNTPIDKYMEMLDNAIAACPLWEGSMIIVDIFDTVPCKDEAFIKQFAHLAADEFCQFLVIDNKLRSRESRLSAPLVTNISPIVMLKW